jgi:hypothetical protein
MLVTKLKYLLLTSTITISLASASEEIFSAIDLEMRHPQILSLSAPENYDVVSSNGIIRTTRWAIKSNNAVVVKFSGVSPVDSVENMVDPNVPRFYKQEVNARGELVTGKYDYLTTNFGAMITNYNSASALQNQSDVSNRSLVGGIGSDVFDYLLYKTTTEEERGEILADVGYDKYGYIQNIDPLTNYYSYRDQSIYINNQVNYQPYIVYEYEYDQDGGLVYYNDLSGTSQPSIASVSVDKEFNNLLYRDLNLASYGQTHWIDEMNNVDYSHAYFPKGDETHKYSFWGRSEIDIYGTPEGLVGDSAANQLWGDIMPNDEGNFILSLYSKGSVGPLNTQSGIYSMTVFLNVTANEQL